MSVCVGVRERESVGVRECMYKCGYERECMCVRGVSERKCMCVCVRERGSVRESVCVYEDLSKNFCLCVCAGL